MYQLLLKIMLVAALLQLGMSLTEFGDCHSLQCFQHIERRSRDLLKIQWQPISVFPSEAKRFK